MTPEEKRRLAHEQAALLGRETHASAYVKKRGEVQEVGRVEFRRLHMTEEEAGSLSTEARLQRQLQEAQAQEALVEGVIKTALGTNKSYDPGYKGFTRERPLIIKLVMGLGDPSDHELPMAMRALDNLRRVRQYRVDSSGQSSIVLELIPVHVYCFKYESGSIAKITAYIKSLMPLNETDDVISTVIAEEDRAEPLIRRIKSLESAHVDMGITRARAILRQVKILNMPSLSSPRGEIESESAQRIILDTLSSGRGNLDMFLSQNMRSGGNRQVFVLPDIPPDEEPDLEAVSVEEGR
jgi:hypothetical protein